MPKLGIFSGSEICAILETEGFLQGRQRGSHVVMQRQTPAGSTTVPVLNHREVGSAHCKPSSVRVA